MSRLWTNSVATRRSTNFYGRTAHSLDEDLKGEMCSLHRYEAGILPLARHFSWPRRFDAMTLLQRLQTPALWFYLKAIWAEPWKSVVIDRPETGKGPDVLMNYRTLYALRDRDRPTCTHGG